MIKHLEVTEDIPKEIKHPSTLCIICHPDPLFGGDMNNKVVKTISEAFNEIGIKSIRFNYSNVGSSTGHYTGKHSALEDTKIVIEEILHKNSKVNIILSGFSFGGAVAYKLLEIFEKDIKYLVIASPTFDYFTLKKYSETEVPWLVIQGNKDEIIDFKQTLDFKKNNKSRNLIIMKDADHFYHGKLIELKRVIKNFFCFL